MDPINPELQQKIAVWRQKAITGDLSLDECKEVVRLIRAGRMEAAKASASAKRATAKKAIPNAEELFGGIEDL